LGSSAGAPAGRLLGGICRQRRAAVARG
jgi:hypothetical protein